MTRSIAWRKLPGAAAVLGSAALVLAAAGCGGPTTHPVRVRVVFADSKEPAKELAGYMATLESSDGTTSAMGVVGPDGSFQVTTFKPGDGAVPGRHRVALTPPLPDGDAPLPPLLIDMRHSDLAQSGLEIDVPAPGGEAILEVRRPGK